MTTTKTIVMSRVRAIHMMRPLVSTGALSLVLGVVSVYAVSREVWVEMVLRNMPDITNVAAVLNFFTQAFLNTGFLVQVFSIVAGISILFLARESMKALSLLSLSRAQA